MLYCIISLNKLRCVANVKYCNKDYHIQHSALALFIVNCLVMAFFKAKHVVNILYNGKDKGQVHPRTDYEGPEGE